METVHIHRRFRRAGLVVAASASLALPVPSLAQAPGECTRGSEASSACVRVGSDEMPIVVVTGTKTEHQAAAAPVPTQVVPRRSIEEMATGNVEAVISQVPDIHVRRNEQFALGASTVRMQGLDPNKVAIVVDGQRFRGGIDGVVDLRDISSAGIEQIEIIRGPSSSVYGSDAMAGVINIRTRRGSKQPYAKLTAAGGTADRRLLTLSHGYHLGSVNYFATVQHEAVAIGKLFGPISAQFDAGRRDDLQTRNSAQLRLDYGEQRRGLRFTGDFLREENPLSFNDNLTTGVGWRWRPAPLWHLDTNASLYQFTRENDLPGFSEDVDYADASGEILLTRAIGGLFTADHVLSLGIRLRGETLESPATMIGENAAQFSAPGVDADTFQYSPFVQEEALLGEAVSIVLGASFDDHSRFGLEMSPRVAVTWRPTYTLRFAASAGRGFRAPDLLQLFDVDVNNVAVIGERVTGYAIVGNSELRAETDWGYTLFAEYQPGTGLRLTLDAFWHDLEDLIGTELVCPTTDSCREGFENPLPDLDGPIFSFQNVDAARSRGLNLSVSLDPLLYMARASGPQAHSIEVNLALGLLDTENLSDIAGQRGKDLPFNPPLRVLPSFAYRYGALGTRLRVWGAFERRQFSDLAASEAGKIGSHWLWNFKSTQHLSPLFDAIGWKPPRWLEGASVFVSGDNVFDREVGFVGPRGRIAPEANFTFGLSYTREGSAD